MITIKRTAAAALVLSIILAACSRHQTPLLETLRIGAQPTQTFTTANKTFLVKQSRETEYQPSTVVLPAPTSRPTRGRSRPIDESSTIIVEEDHPADNNRSQSNRSQEETFSGEGKMITYFTVWPSTADPGDTVKVEWKTTRALTVTVWHLTPTGQMGAFWPAKVQGSLTYDISPDERNRSTFALTVQSEQGKHEIATASVTLRCTGPWFFETAPEICPAKSPMNSTGAEQHFEEGHMIWVAEEDLIYVLYSDSSYPKWTVYPDTWDESQVEIDQNLTPPNGLFQPTRGFGLVWRNQQEVRDRLGWAVDREVGYHTVVQRTSYAKYNSTYIKALDGSIWYLQPEQSGWGKVDP